MNIPEDLFIPRIALFLLLLKALADSSHFKLSGTHSIIPGTNFEDISYAFCGKIDVRHIF